LELEVIYHFPKTIYTDKVIIEIMNNFLNCIKRWESYFVHRIWMETHENINKKII